MPTLKSNDFVRVNSFGLAKRGRDQGDDYFDVRIYNDLVVAVVADGVGSAQEGRTAAIRTTEALLKNFKIRPNSWSIEKSLENFITSINHILYQESMDIYQYTELITTLAVIVIQGDKLYGANVGDTRVYIKREERLQQLNKDHNLNQKDMTHVLTKAIGLDDEVEPFYFSKSLQKGDKLLLCSDGLYNELDNKELLNGIDIGPKHLVKLALKKQDNGQLPDDTSAVIVDILSESTLPNKEVINNLLIPLKLQIGDVIDGYTLVKPLIQNQRTWKVVRGLHYFVMKFAPLAAIDDKRISDLFITEVWNAKRLKAGFFPKAAVPKKRSMRYYIMNYIEGNTLKEHIKKKPLSIDEAIEIGKFLLKASQFLTKFNLLHGDIKPENIMITYRHDKPVYKLIDFGSIVETFAIDSKAGTPSYLAPERFKGDAICEQTEIYAIGVTLYESLCKKFPYGEIEPFQTPSFTKTIKSPQSTNKNIPNWLESIIQHALSTDTNRRYKNFSEMYYDLERPDEVKPFYRSDASFIEKDPLKFYKYGFFILLIFNIILLIKLQ
ncbi:MAG: protein phosphatase 2C domain-containing protein [Thiovulaceae bacterium]|nr:protein phosphatase 2C domain-containing protein [Sulfurimonadaceae bacterium]